MNELLPKAPEGAAEHHAQDYRGILFTLLRRDPGKRLELNLHGGHENYLKGQYLERYQTNDELVVLREPGTPMAMAVDVVKIALNRLIDNVVVYGGDLTRRYEVN